MKKASLAILLSSVLATGTVFAQSSGYGDTNTMGGAGSTDQSQLQNQQQPSSTESTTPSTTSPHGKKHKKSKSENSKSDTKSW